MPLPTSGVGTDGVTVWEQRDDDKRRDFGWAKRTTFWRWDDNGNAFGHNAGGTFEAWHRCRADQPQWDGDGKPTGASGNSTSSAAEPGRRWDSAARSIRRCNAAAA